MGRTWDKLSRGSQGRCGLRPLATGRWATRAMSEMSDESLRANREAIDRLPNVGSVCPKLDAFRSASLQFPLAAVGCNWLSVIM